MAKISYAIFHRAPGNYDPKAASDESALGDFDASKTQQHFAEECDINTIVKRFNLTGQLPENIRTPTYGDFDGVFDFQTAMNAIRAAEEAFAAMPAEIRTRFNNDPGRFVDFCSDLTDDLNDFANRAEMERMGLVVPKKPSTGHQDTARAVQATGEPPAPPSPPKEDKKPS